MAGKTVLFNIGNLSARGEPVVHFQYAHYNETLLGNRSVILVPKEAEKFSMGMFTERFDNIVVYNSIDELLPLSQKADLVYMIAYGDMPAEFPWQKLECKTGIHCVFTAHHPYGDVYAAVSEWVADTYGLWPVPVVPHIVHLPDDSRDLRKELGIAESAVVIGRYGGYNQFNLLAVHQAIAQAVNKRPDLYFLFMNTRPFFDHPRIIYLPPHYEFAFKTRFINTCDAMIHARLEGETFGLSIGEFSIRGKPIITWRWSFDRHHLNVLGDHAICYESARELFTILMNFKRGTTARDCYSERYNPEKVMQIFEKVFLT